MKIDNEDRIKIVEELLYNLKVDYVKNEQLLKYNQGTIILMPKRAEEIEKHCMAIRDEMKAIDETYNATVKELNFLKTLKIMK